MHRLVVAVARRCVRPDGVNKVAAGAKSAKCPPNLYTFPISVFGQSRGEPPGDPRQTKYAAGEPKLIHGPGPKQATPFRPLSKPPSGISAFSALPIGKYRPMIF